MIDKKLANRVSKIIDDVCRNGDKALSAYSLKFDGVKLPPKNFRLTAGEIEDGAARVSKEIKRSMDIAAANVRFFHENEIRNFRKRWAVTKNGITAGQYYAPVESAGIYVSGGIYAYYPSIVLMCALPARAAGVKRIVMITPPKNVVPEVLYAAKTAGITEIYRLGGAHAVAALTFGTKTVPKVDFIAGPGSKYVTEAKRQVFGEVGIDLLAGPSEVAVICDSSADAAATAADVLAQAEHSPDARSYVFCDSSAFIAGLKGKIREGIGKNKKRAPHLSVKQIKIIKSSLKDSIHSVNALAPEHLEIIHRKAETIIAQIKNAGAVFVGNFTPVALGDYYAGPSHVLPTAGTARFSSGLSALTFMKRTSVMRASPGGLKKASPGIIKLAESEKLKLHAESIRVRLSRGES